MSANVFFAWQHSEICSAWQTTPTITGATVALAWQTKGLRKKRLCWQQQCDFFRSASPPRQAYNRLVSPLAGKGVGVLVGGFFLFGTFSFWPHRKKKYIAYVNSKFTRKMGKRDLFPRNVVSLFSAARKRMNTRGCWEASRHSSRAERKSIFKQIEKKTRDRGGANCKLQTAY